MIIACIISFVVGAMLMMLSLGIVSVCKDKEPQNKVRFYITCQYSDCYPDTFTLWLGMPMYNPMRKKWIKLYDGAVNELAYSSITFSNFEAYGLKRGDFMDMKDGEIREVFIDLENYRQKE